MKGFRGFKDDSKKVKISKNWKYIFCLTKLIFHGVAYHGPGYFSNHLFERFGGHEQAAGMTIKSELLTEFRMRISEYANNRLEPTDLVRRLAIDSELPFSSINESLMSGLSSLEPFGLGNRRPVFQTESVEIVDGPHKLKEQHLRMTVRQDGRRFRAVAWRAASRERIFNERKKSLKLAFSLSENTYRGETSIELNIADVK